jgi:hypothetical protein
MFFWHLGRRQVIPPRRCHGNFKEPLLGFDNGMTMGRFRGFFRKIPFFGIMLLITGWWFQPTPLKNDGVKVSWDGEIPN